eukprot:UN19301
MVDRLRAIRQDYRLLFNMNSVIIKDRNNIMENIIKMIKFHSVLNFQCADYTIEEFDPVLNRQMLQDCFSLYFEVYRNNDEKPGGQKGDICMFALYLLLKRTKRPNRKHLQNTRCSQCLSILKLLYLKTNNPYLFFRCLVKLDRI